MFTVYTRARARTRKTLLSRRRSIRRYVLVDTLVSRFRRAEGEAPGHGAFQATDQRRVPEDEPRAGSGILSMAEGPAAQQDLQ